MFAQLSSASTDRVKEAVKSLLQFIEITTRISGAHSVEFYTEEVWKNQVAVSPEAVLSAFSQQQQLEHGCKGQHYTDFLKDM